MKKHIKKVTATIIAMVMTIMLLPLSESISVSAVDVTNWIDLANTDWYTEHNTDISFSISTAEELAGLASLVNGGTDFAGKTINLKANIVLNENAENFATWGTSAPANTWTTIGYYNSGADIKSFDGVFNGNGHTVSGIYINSSDGRQGLFGLATGGTIKNLGVINSYIKAQGNVGSICGHNGTIINCYNTGSVSGASNVGGINGYNATITNCYNSGKVTGDSSVGGISGGDSTILDCYNIGKVSGTSNIGGILGSKGFFGMGTATNCYYCGCNVGIGGDGVQQTGTTPFVKIKDNPLGINKTTTIKEQTTADINTAWANGLGADFTVVYLDTYISSDVSVVTASDTTLTGKSVGNANITGRTLKITQNGLTTLGFTGDEQTYTVSLSLPLEVTADGGGEEASSTPIVTTQDVTDITTTTATGNGNITDLGSPNPTAYGVCWGVNDNPTIADSKTDNGAGSATGAFTGSITGLSPSTTYYVRAYATNSAGTSYGNQIMFTTEPINIFTVTFDSNGGSDIAAITNVSGGTKITKPADPTKAGYTFDGWLYDSGEMTYEWNFEMRKVMCDMTLTAQWTKNSTPTPTPTYTPDPEPELEEEKTLEVIETPEEIKNPEKIEVEPNGEAFDESVEVRLKDDPQVKETIEKALDTVVTENKEVKVYPLDISLYKKGTDTKVQPNTGTSVTITCPIPESLLEDKDNVKVVCMIDGKLQILETKLVSVDGVHCVRFTANHFSPYAIVVDKGDALSGIENDTTDESATTEDKKTDIVDTNPTTGDNSVLPIALMVILSVTTFVISRKKIKA